MAAVTVNDDPVISGLVSFPLQGRWVGELTLQGTNPGDVSGKVTLTIGSVPFVGFSTAEADAGNRVTATIVGGAGGLLDEVAPQHYVAPVNVGIIVRDALAVGGEVLSVTSDSSVVNESLSQWTRVRGTVADALKSVLTPLGATYRVLPDGSIWIGKESWLPLAADPVIESESPTRSSLRVAIEDASILPGVSFNGKNIKRATYEIDSARIRAELVYGDQPVDDERTAFREKVRQDTKAFDFFAPYVAKVVARNADDTVELQCSDPRLPSSMSKIPFRSLPGVTALKVRPGTFSILQFEGGDPSKAFVSSSYLTGVDQITIDCPDIRLGSDAARFVAIADLVKAQLDNIALIFNTHVHSGGTIGGSTGTPAAPIQVQDVAASKVKAE